MALQVDSQPSCSSDTCVSLGLSRLFAQPHPDFLHSPCTPLACRVKTPPAAFNSKHISHLLGQDRGLCLLNLQSSLAFTGLLVYLLIMLGLQWVIYTENIISQNKP